MSVPKEVVLDLLPMYLAGELTPITRAWVEERLAQDPQLAERVRRQAAQKIDAAAPLPSICRTPFSICSNSWRGLRGAMPISVNLRAPGRTCRSKEPTALL